MTVEERRGSNARGGGGGGGPNDQFPVGMRVLAVDDDPVCLKLLECLLRRCQYHVTTTNQAIIALKMLRENKDRFDLVISDVHMPDMDGFKLLELVGLEMDLPVIMLSANSDPKAVMQGITHGACDYLLKPVRIEELKNIWQHVVRRWKIDSKDHHIYEHGDDSDKPGQANSEDGHSAHSDRNGRLNKKRKDQNEEDDDDCEDSGRENDDTSTQKKPRVVWTADLHRKFVAAVNQLGIDKAMPKRILDLMNDDKLTRENVASHLQKYRLYLKRISQANQQASIAAALGAKDTTYVPMGSFDCGRSYDGFTSPGQLSTLASFQQGGMLGRLNGVPDPGMYNLGSSGAIQFGHFRNNATSNICDLGKLSNITFSGTTQTNLLQGIPTSLEFNQLQQQKTMFGSSNPIPSGSAETSFSAGISSNSMLNTMNSNQMLQHPPPHQQQSRAFGNISTVGSMSLRTDPFELRGGTPSYLLDLRCDDNWPTGVPLSGFSSHNLPLNIPFSQETPRSNDSRCCVRPVTSNIDVNLHTAGNAHLTNTLVGSNLHSQVDPLGGNIAIMPTSISDIPVLSDTRSADYTQLCWEGQKQSQLQKHYVTSNFSSNTVGVDNGLIDVVDIKKSGFNHGSSSQKLDATMIEQSHFNNSSYSQNCNLARPSSNGETSSIKLQGAFDSNGYDTFDDLMTAMTKRQEWEDVLMDGDINCDAYSLGACM